jgi:hypothetical protein
LAVVDFDLKFSYVLVGWEESAHDASILADSLSIANVLNIPDGKLYLGDVGYACQPRILPSFRKTMYHLGSSLQGTGPRILSNCSISDTLVLESLLRGSLPL